MTNRVVPSWAKKKQAEKEVKEEVAFQDGVVEPLMGLIEEDVDSDKEAEAAMRNCKCPGKCSVHPRT